MTGLTSAQRDCKAFILGYQEEHGCAPAYSEIMLALGLHSNSCVHRLVHGLAKRGHVSHDPYLHRSVEVIPDDSRHFALGYEQAALEFLELELAGFKVRKQGRSYYLYRINATTPCAGPFAWAKHALDEAANVVAQEGKP